MFLEGVSLLLIQFGDDSGIGDKVIYVCESSFLAVPL